MSVTRRSLIATALAGLATSGRAQTRPFRFALTPAFLDNDAAVLGQLRAAIASATGDEIEFVQRRTYRSVAGRAKPADG